jgi:hypothetical protein
MSDTEEKTREQLMRVVNDIIFMAHRTRVPSKRLKNIFVDHILRLGELREYFGFNEDDKREGDEEKD